MRTLYTSACLLIASALAVLAGDEVVCLEAESGRDLSAPLHRVDAGSPPEGHMRPVAAGASGASYLEVPQGKGNPPKVKGGTATYSVTLREGGTYTLWCRVWWLDECGNSLGIHMGEAPPFTFGQDATYKRWHWVKSPPRVRQLKLEAGTHTLKIANREDGMRIDQILLSNDRRFVPVDIERATP